MEQAIGWTASLILLCTIFHQVRQQWKAGGEGASIWLFIGQSCASVGFVTYSVLGGDWVFIVTNTLLLCSALIGIWICVRR